MISPSRLDPIIPYMPSGPVPESNLNNLYEMDEGAPRQAGALIIAELARCHQLATEIIRENSHRINRAFDLVAHPRKITIGSLEDITMGVLQLTPSEVTHPALWAVHMTIVGTCHFQLNFFDSRKFSRIYILSKKLADRVALVKLWTREYQEEIIAETTGIEYNLGDHDTVNPLAGFIAKSQALITLSRKTRAVTKQGSVGPIDSKLTKKSIGTIFTRDERSILDFFSLWASGYFRHIEHSSESMGSTILRATKMYDDFQLGGSTAFVFLQELGIHRPWANRDDDNPMFPIEKQGNTVIRGKLGAELRAFSPSLDSMAQHRKDWGETRVFCIDWDSSQEVDDGVSIEEIPNDPSASWVHIHVANPSAFIDPTSHISLHVEELVSSRYLVHRNYSMLPSELSVSHLSLANNRPCMTMSAKVTIDGDIADYKISHGIIHNVRHMTPGQLRQEMTPERANWSRRTTIVVGDEDGHFPLKTKNPPSVPPHLLTSDRNLLGKLSGICEARRRKRSQAGALLITRPTSEVAVSGLVKDHKNRGKWSVYFDDHDPTISLTTEISNPGEASHHAYEITDIVEELMILAGEVAASWCAKRNIPVAYRGTLRNPDPSERPELFKQRFLNELMTQTEFTPLPVLNRFLGLVGSNVPSAFPMEHYTLGISAYSRVTSPLRRYTDLFTHWQIEAAIRHESETGRSLIGNTDNGYLPFSFSRVETLLHRVAHMEKLIRKVQADSEYHWKTQLLFRAFHFKQAPLPETFQVVLSLFLAKTMLYIGYLKEFELFCDVPTNDAMRRHGPVCEGDLWESRIIEVDCYRRKVRMEPLRLISREPKQVPVRA